MKQRFAVYILAPVSLVVAGGTIALLLWHRTPIPEWKARLLEQPTMDMPVNPNPHSSIEGLEARMYLTNDLKRREFWGEQEVDEVIEILSASPQSLVPTESVTTDREFEVHALTRDAQAAIRTRIGIGAPIDPAQRERLVDALLERSHAADSSIRLGLAEAFCWSGLIFEDERVDERVREMMNDPEPMVAANARNQYRFHSEGREKWAEYQRRQGRDIPPKGG